MGRYQGQSLMGKARIGYGNQTEDFRERDIKEEMEIDA